MDDDEDDDEDSLKPLFRVTGTTEAERALMIRETTRVLRWRAATNAIVIVAVLGAMVASCWAVCQ